MESFSRFLAVYLNNFKLQHHAIVHKYLSDGFQ